MRHFLRKLLRILDGAPTQSPPSKYRQRGQSLLEMAFITPLLALLVAGAVEVGWYANHFLTLLEVTRVGARAGTFLQDDFHPRFWNREASVIPWIQTTHMGEPMATAESNNYRNCGTVGQFPGFYNFIACTMVNSMDPLILDNANNIDDIVISVFGTQKINNVDLATVNPITDPELYKRTIDFDNPPGGAPAITRYMDGHQVIVVSRFPANANECNASASNTLLTDADAAWEHDPFDYITNEQRDFYTSDGIVFFIEDGQTDGAGLLDDNTPPPGGVGMEYQRGFVWLGQHQVESEDVLCWGSEWNIAEVEALFNLPGFIDQDEEREFLTSQGITLVELFWKHDLILNFPIFRPILNAFGDNDRIIIAVWSAFPLPTVEPNIIYQFPP